MLNRIDRKKAACEMAVFNWERRLNGVYYWWESKRYTKQFCIEQIEYFKKMKTKCEN
jgi:hypothetical protein